MLTKGQAVKVTIHLNEDTRSHVEPLWSVVFGFLKQKRVAGASVLRPEAGFGSHNSIHDVKSEYQGDHLPIRIEFIESPARVDELLPTLYELVTDGLIETQPVTVIKNCASGRELQVSRSPEPQPTESRLPQPAKLVRIFLGESDKLDDEPLYEAIVKKLRMLDFAGATVFRGILGYGVKKHTHRSGLLPFSRDLPIVISVVERADRLEELLNAVTALLQDGLIAVSDIDMYRTLVPPPAPQREQ